MTLTPDWTKQSKAEKLNSNLWTKWLWLADRQSKNQTLWFLLSLVGQGVFFLPVPALLIYYYNAPIVVLVITLFLFFSNIIAGMGGSGIRTTLTLFAVSVLIHLLMLAVYIL